MPRAPPGRTRSAATRDVPGARARRMADSGLEGSTLTTRGSAGTQRSIRKVASSVPQPSRATARRDVFSPTRSRATNGDRVRSISTSTRPGQFEQLTGKMYQLSRTGAGSGREGEPVPQPRARASAAKTQERITSSPVQHCSTFRVDRPHSNRTMPTRSTPQPRTTSRTATTSP